MTDETNSTEPAADQTAIRRPLFRCKTAGKGRVNKTARSSSSRQRMDCFGVWSTSLAKANATSGRLSNPQILAF
jgi:hypothetical protein